MKIAKGCLVRTVVPKHWCGSKSTVFLTISDPYENDQGEAVIQVHPTPEKGHPNVYYVSSLEVISGV